MGEAITSEHGIPPALLKIIDLLACPVCGSDLGTRGDELICLKQRHTWSLKDQIALLARSGTAETWQDDSEDQTSQTYQDKYQDADQATSYNHAYADKFLKRRTTRREYRLLTKLLGSHAKCATLLDVPCGGGRLSDQMEPHADILIEADTGLGQLQYLVSNATPQTSRVWMTASAFHLPLKPLSVDGVVCVRLCHHLPTPVERERLVEELLRVSKRFVIMTFFDYHSPKNYLRRARRPFNHKPPKMTMTVGRLKQLANENGAELVACPALWWLGSGHRYALMVKK